MNREYLPCRLEIRVKRPHYFDMPLKKRLPFTAILCACLFIVPPFIVGFIDHWPDHWYKDIQVIYGYLIVISVFGEIYALSHRKKDRSSTSTIEENSINVAEELCDYLWRVSFLLAGFWILDLIGALAGWW